MCKSQNKKVLENAYLIACPRMVTYINKQCPVLDGSLFALFAHLFDRTEPHPFVQL
jgi:hypothetical protein